nr:molybdate ABC transporter permease subunit [Thermocrinis sp.]
MNSLDITPFWLTLELSFWTTLILLFLGIPLAYFLAYSRSRYTSLVEALVSLPLVLPPTVLGFYLLLALNKEGFIGALWYRLFGKQLVFHFEGILIASVIYSLPMMVHPLTAGFRSVPKNLIEASYTLGKSKWETLIKVILPNTKASVLTGIVLSFAHTLGEFGVVLM